MGTIQVRDLPDEVHRIHRQRAAAGMSLQEYLRAELIRSVSLRSPDELARDMEQRLQVEGDDGFAPSSSAEVLRQDRAAH
jgi:plasmid stability protein